jgi:hypothetical protein
MRAVAATARGARASLAVVERFGAPFLDELPVFLSIGEFVYP